MKKYRFYFIFAFINLILSMVLMYINPRFDILTLFGFVFINALLVIILILHDKNEEKKQVKKIDDIFTLIHNLNLDSENYEIVDDDFGKLRDEIVKIILENKNLANTSIKNRDILSEYIEDISHQIKTPLTGILLMVDLLESDRENSAEYITYIRKNINRLYQLVDILLKMASLDSNVTEMKKEKVDVLKLIEDIKSDLQVYFANKNIEIILPRENFYIVCDSKWTYEALFNIVKNALESTTNDKVSIEFQETNISKSIIVRDYGKGMTKDMLKNALKRFYKENPDSKGHGIGLPMAKSIMQRQGGELLYFKEKDSNYFELKFYI